LKPSVGVLLLISNASQSKLAQSVCPYQCSFISAQSPRFGVVLSQDSEKIYIMQ
jgi:hypothetical protein